jgi:hypothetical protein
MDYQIIAYRPDGPDRDRTIELLKLHNGSLLSPAEMAGHINARRHNFWVAGPPKAWVEAVPAATHGRWHVRTVPDGTYLNNIHALPKF